MSRSRKDGRSFKELRRVEIIPDTAPYAEGSAEVRFGNTHLLVTASVEKEIPKWMEGEGQPAAVQKGWVTAEYGMLPRATHTRNRRESAQGKQGGRTLEIQRLIGRALRAGLDLTMLPGITIRVDCDVLCADGGTRIAAINGGWVALAKSLQWCIQNGLVPAPVKLEQIAAVSVGIVRGIPLLDLCYEEDSSADFDLNVVQDEKLRLIEVQGTAEHMPISQDQLTELLGLASDGIKSILTAQRAALG